MVNKAKRTLPFEMDKIIKNINLETDDIRSTELVGLTIDNIKVSKLTNRILGLEKSWDAFERMNVYYSAKKNKSVEQLVSEVLTGTDKFDDILYAEFKASTQIGNKY